MKESDARQLYCPDRMIHHKNFGSNCQTVDCIAWKHCSTIDSETNKFSEADNAVDVGYCRKYGEWEA